jgi:hypothetical protein
MNLALFVTQANKASLPGIVSSLAASQQELVNGAIVVIHDSLIPKSDLSFTLPLADRFKVSASLPVQVNAAHSESDHLAAMFSSFLTVAYARYPGPWLLFDEPALPKGDNWMQAALRQHGAFGGKMTGRASVNPGSTRPIGPVTLEFDFKALKVLRFPTRQNWRERGQFLFSRAGFQLVPADQWLFSMRNPECAAAQSEPAIAHPVAVEATQLEGGVFIEPNPEYFTPPLESLTDDELRDLIRVATGKAPHHFTGRDKLLQMAKELTTAPA